MRTVESFSFDSATLRLLLSLCINFELVYFPLCTENHQVMGKVTTLMHTFSFAVVSQRSKMTRDPLALFGLLLNLL